MEIEALRREDTGHGVEEHRYDVIVQREQSGTGNPWL